MELYTILYRETAKDAKPANGEYCRINNLRVLNMRSYSDSHSRYQALSLGSTEG